MPEFLLTDVGSCPKNGPPWQGPATNMMAIAFMYARQETLTLDCKNRRTPFLDTPDQRSKGVRGLKRGERKMSRQEYMSNLNIRNRHVGVKFPAQREQELPKNLSILCRAYGVKVYQNRTMLLRLPVKVSGNSCLLYTSPSPRDA